jgi:gamma-glutamyltranspeptidase/glutathione hydrolase
MRGTGCALLLFTFAATLAAQSTANYERVVVSQGRGGRQTMKAAVWGTRHAVTSMSAHATLAAERILRVGGNAFDAVVAGQAVLGLVQPASNGIGGDAVLLVYDSKQKKVWSINAEGTAPKLATIEWYRKNQNGKLPVDDGLLAATTPGVIDAWYLLLSRWGTMSFAQVLEPAIELAERGLALSRGQARSWGGNNLIKYPSSARLYAPDGKRWQEGDIWKNLDLARTFRRLIEAEEKAKSGGREAGLKAARDRFYKGDIAREMAQFSEKNGGLFRYEDFASYSAKVEEPVSVNYRGYDVYKNPSASQGPAELLMLNLLETFDLKAMGHNSAEYLHTSIEATKLAMADRDKYMGDMDFIKIPYTGLLSEAYTTERRGLIDAQRASLELRPGAAERHMPGFEPVNRPSDVNLTGNADHEGDTSYIAVVDDQRNAVSFTPSLHSGFGSKVVMAELGFSFNCRGDYYSLVEGHANALAPGKRPRSTLQGTIVLRDGKPFLVTGSPGGDDQCMRTMQTFLNIVEFGMDVQEAIEAPRWSTKAFPASPFPHTMYPGEASVENRVPEPVRAELVRRGHKLYVVGGWSIGNNAAILVHPTTGVVSAGADPRVPALALAW